MSPWLPSSFYTPSPAADVGGGVPVLSRVRECVRGPPGVHKKLRLHCIHYLYFGVMMVKIVLYGFSSTLDISILEYPGPQT